MPLAPTLYPALPLAVAVAAAVVYLGLVAVGKRGRVRIIKVVPAVALAVVNPPLAPVLLAWGLGDALLLDKDRFFLHGLGAFLIGHVLYIGSFAPNSGVSLPALGVGLMLAGTMMALLWGALKPKLKLPVALYAIALAGVLGVAAPAGHALGAILFLVSDTILAWNRFRSPLPRGDLLVMVTYYGAVFAIALG